MYQLLQIVALILAAIAMALSLARVAFVSPVPASGRAAMRGAVSDDGCAV